jgi:hypothetical protein
VAVTLIGLKFIAAKQMGLKGTNYGINPHTPDHCRIVSILPQRGMEKRRSRFVPYTEQRKNSILSR